MKFSLQHAIPGSNKELAEISAESKEEAIKEFRDRFPAIHLSDDGFYRDSDESIYVVCEVFDACASNFKKLAASKEFGSRAI